MKKTAWLLIMTMIVSLCGCGSSGNNATEIRIENCKQRLNVADYGIVAESKEEAVENSKKLNHLISSAEEYTAICFDDGNYYFESNGACINISNKKSLLLYGENAVIINTSFDPTTEVTQSNYHESMTVSVRNSQNVRIEGLSFDYSRFTQACGKIVEKKDGVTAIQLASGFTDGTYKAAITGEEIASAIAVLDEKGAAIEDYYADGSFACWLQDNRLYVKKDFGKIGNEAVVRFKISTAPEFYAEKTEKLTIDNVQSYSSPAAAFLMSGEGNKDFTFNNIIVAPPENAVWRWGCNVDGIFINCMRGELKITNCKFVGMGDDALNVHSTAAKVSSVNGNRITLKYAYNNTSVSNNWARVGDTLNFYTFDFKLCAKAKIEKENSGTISLNIIEGTVKQGHFVENESLSPKVAVENVTVNGGRARAFLLQTDNVTIKNCDISNLGLAGIIISPDISKWFEMGPAQNVTISGCSFKNVCAMGGDNCKGAIFTAASHDGYQTAQIIHKNISIINNTFSDFSVPAVNLTSVSGVVLRDNTYLNSATKPIITNCENVIEE